MNWHLPKGIDLLPVIMEVYIWAEKYYEMPADLKATIKEAKKDKDKFIKQVTTEVKIKMTGKKAAANIGIAASGAGRYKISHLRKYLIRSVKISQSGFPDSNYVKSFTIADCIIVRSK